MEQRANVLRRLGHTEMIEGVVEPQRQNESANKESIPKEEIRVGKVTGKGDKGNAPAVTRSILIRCFRMCSHSGAEAWLKRSRRENIYYGMSQSGLRYKPNEDDEKNSSDNVEDAFDLKRGK